MPLASSHPRWQAVDMNAQVATTHFFHLVTHVATEWAAPRIRSGFIAPDKEPVDASVITNTVDFDSVAMEWDQLHAESRASVFQSHSWSRAWWRHFGEAVRTRELHLVVVRKRGVLIALAPFYIESRKFSGMTRTRELRFIGEGISDYGDIVLKPGHEQDGLQAVTRHLGRLWKSIDCICLSNLPDESPAMPMLTRLLEEAGVCVSLRQSDTCPRTRLRASWQETLAGLNSKKRCHLKKRCTQLAEEHSMGIEFIENPDGLDQALSDLIRMHQERMNESGKAGVFHDPGFEGFFREILEDFLARGWLFLSFLTVDGKRVAAACSYLLNNVVSLHIAGLGNVGNIRKYSPGMVLHALCMEKAIQRGAKTYDFLRGTEEYKYRLGAQNQPVWSIFAKRVRLSVRILRNVETIFHDTRRAA
jgi:CelD/BcsL family acetyltransferase involved in cellulose biosynthesis